MKLLQSITVKKFFLAIVAANVFVFLQSNTVIAQTTEDGLSLTISPYLFDLRSQPGSIVKDKLRVYNNLTEEVALKPIIRPLKPQGEQGAAVPEEGTEQDAPYLKWITFENESVTARPREWVDIPFEIEVPEEAAYGYYYAISLVPENLTNQQIEGAQTNLQGQITAFVLMNVEREGAISQLNLLSFNPIQTIFEYQPVKIETRVENVGNIHIRPKGNIFIRRPGTSTDLAILEINETNGNVLPDTRRIFESFWDDGFAVRDPKTGEIKLNWEKLTKFRLGQYEARLALVYFDGSKDVLIEDTKTFWIIPYTAIAVIIISIIVIILTIRWIIKSYVRKQLKKLSVPQTPAKKDNKIR